MKYLLRSCFAADPTDRLDLLEANYHALTESRLGFEVPEDTVIWTFITDFFRAHGHVPSLATLRTHFASVHEADVVDRLERVAIIKPRTRGDFLNYLEEKVKDARSRIDHVIRKRATTIAHTGIEVGRHGPRPQDPEAPKWWSVEQQWAGRKLRGPEDARAWEIAAREMTDAEAPRSVDSGWPEARPLEGAVDREGLPAVPLDALPDPLYAVVEALAVEAQVDAAMVVPYALACVAACGQRVHHVEVREGWIEVLGLYTATIAEPGERKSAVVRRLTAPIQAWEAEQLVAAQDAGHRHEAELAALKQDAKAAKGSDLIDLQVQIQEHEQAKPTAPRVIVSDVTQEELVRQAATQGGSIALLTAEGAGPVAVAGGRYSGQRGGTSYDALLAGHAGDAIQVDRVSRESLRVPSPSFVVGLACQLDVLRGLASIPGARGTGLLARFLYAFPCSMVGRRSVRAPSMPADVVDQWERLLRGILDASKGLSNRVPLRFDADALETLLTYAEGVEPRLGPGGNLRAISDWANKMVGTVARLAGLFALVETTDLPAQTVPMDCVRRAILLAPWLEAHARAAYAAGIADESLGHATEVLEWLRAQTGPTSVRDLQRALKGRAWLRRVADLEGPLRRLVDHGWIRIDQQPSTGGRKPSPVITVRPEDPPTVAVPEPAPSPRPEPRQTIREAMVSLAVRRGDSPTISVPRGRPPKMPLDAMRCSARPVAVVFQRDGSRWGDDDDDIDVAIASQDGEATAILFERVVAA